MKYIDLDNGVYTDPETGKRIDCFINHWSRWYFLSLNHRSNALPFKALDLYDTGKRIDFLKRNGFAANACSVSGLSFPELSSRDECIRLCNLLNEMLTEKYGDYTSEIITLSFD